MTRFRPLLRGIPATAVTALALMTAATTAAAGTPPNTTITGGPSGTVMTTRVSFTFESSRNNSTFKCSMDGAAWVACTSPRSYGRLADGPHTFRVKAKNDTLVDETPASRSFTVHSGAPSVTIKGGPGSATTSSTVTFSFYADEDNVTFQCRLDSNPWVSCSSPYTTYAGSANHQHVFKVRATDSDGNTGLPASYDYTRFA